LVLEVQGVSEDLSLFEIPEKKSLNHFIRVFREMGHRETPYFKCSH